jgi:Ankyrin repeats (many copies)
MIMQRSLAIGSFFWGCLAVFAAYSLLPQSSAAAQSVTRNHIATSSLFRAVQANDLAGVQKAVSEGADFQARDKWGMTAADIAVDRGHYRIAHFLAAARKPHRDQQTTSGVPSTIQKSAAASSVSTRQKSPVQGATNDSPKIDSLLIDENDARASEWPAGEPNPFDPTAPAPGSQLRAMQAY